MTPGEYREGRREERTEEKGGRGRRSGRGDIGGRKMIASHSCSQIHGTHFFSSSSSQTHASRSRWLVGSSRSRRVGRTNSALAREIRILHPPEKSLHFISCISVVNPTTGGLVTRQKVSTNLTLNLHAITPNCSV